MEGRSGISRESESIHFLDDNYVYYLKNEFVNEKPIVNYTHNESLRKSHKTTWVEI